MNHADCPFCQPLPRERILAESDSFIAFYDGYPVSQGHALVVPRQHVASLFELPEPEYLQLWAQVVAIRWTLTEQFHTTAFNIGVNDGRAAGQTVGHAHIHIIPRYDGDLPDPRGGVRWVIPAKAKYW
jgi:diadenosine tetraphosphate (Ap4A) HIT family hydrolase